MGTGKAAEHGLGAGLSIGRESRVRPLKRFKVCADREIAMPVCGLARNDSLLFDCPHEQGGTA